MPHIILNELVVSNLSVTQKQELMSLFSAPDPFDAILPVPSDVSVLGDSAVDEWCERSWGTSGLHGPFESIVLESDTLFGDKADDNTLIAPFLTVWTPPDGIVRELSRRFPNAVFDLRFLDYDDVDGDVGWYRFLNGRSEFRSFSKDDYPDFRDKLLRTPATWLIPLR